MRLRGDTSTDDWNPLTLFWMMARRKCWHFDFDLKEWRLRADYTWYDGPIFQLWVGPLCVWLICH